MGRRRVLFFNLGGGPHQDGDSFAFTEGGLAHSLYSFSPLSDLYDTRIVCPNVPLDVAGRRFSVDGVTVECPSPPSPARWIWSDEFSFTERRSHTFARMPALLGSYVRLRRESIVMRPDVVLANGVLASYLASREWSHVVVIAVIHHLYQDTWTRGSDEATRGFTARAERWLLSHMKVDGVAVVNPAVRERLVEMGFESDRVVLVGNGVDPDTYSFKPPERPGDIIYVGRLRRDKRVETLIEMMAIVAGERPGTVLHIVGDGGQRRSLERLARRRGVADRVRFHGYVSEGRKVRLLQSASVYVSGSRFEGFGIPVVEAMATGAVPVVSDIPAHRFIFQDRRVGFLVDGPNEMASRVLEVLSDEPARLRMAHEGRGLVEERWTWDAVASRYHALVEKSCLRRDLTPSVSMA